MLVAMLLALGPLAYAQEEQEESGAVESPAPSAEPAPTAEEAAAAERFVNDLGMEFRLIPPGTFQMGSNRLGGLERPVHEVTITKAFYLGVFEVTQEQWEAVMGTNPSYFKDPKRPVENVSWHDAQGFCRKLSEREGGEYRLPTEAEWEYGCRAGTTTAYYWGDEFDGDYAWCEDNSGGTSHPVGSRKPNVWGLHDMAGNVYEWCADTFSRYASGAVSDPKDESDSPFRVDRGGSWYSARVHCYSADRGGRIAEFRDFFVGFRVARAKE